jgi:hypothetical protein
MVLPSEHFIIALLSVAVYALFRDRHPLSLQSVVITFSDSPSDQYLNSIYA